jgi:aryl-alcohol dehydrogenase
MNIEAASMRIAEGDADPYILIPFVVDKMMTGAPRLDRLAKFYALGDINQAIADSSSGLTIKPILRMPH